MAAALPFALLLYAHVAAQASRALLVAAIVALAVPWQAIAELPVLADLSAFGPHRSSRSCVPSRCF